MSKKKLHANRWNRPIWKEYIWIICLSWGFAGLNLIVYAIRLYVHQNGDKLFYGSVGMLGCLFLLFMVPMSIFDKRKGMQGSLYAIVSLIIGIVIGIALTFLDSFWWIVFLCIEFLIGIGVLMVHKNYLLHCHGRE